MSNTKILQRLEEITTQLAKAIESSPSKQKVTLYKPQHSKYNTAHLVKGCGKLAQSKPTPHERGRSSWADSLCPTCLTYINSLVGTASMKILRSSLAAGSLENATQKVKAFLDEGLLRSGDQRFASLRSAQRSCETAYKLDSSNFGEVARELQEVTRYLQDEIMRAVPDQEEALKRWCSALIAHDRNGNTSSYHSWDTKVDTLEQNTELEKSLDNTRPLYNAVFHAWTEALLDSKDDTVARELAVAKAWVYLRGEPRSLRFIPKTVRLKGADFNSPQEWAIAEWRLACQDALDEAITAWEQARDKTLASYGDETVLLALANVPDDHASAVVRVLTLTKAQFEPSKKLALVSVPDVVYIWFRHQGKYMTGKHKLTIKSFGSGLQDGLLEVAIGLYEPGSGGVMKDLTKAIDAGRMMS